MARINIPKELAKNSLLLTSLHGLKAVLERELGVKNIILSQDDKVKQAMENDAQIQRADPKVVYPYAWLQPSDAQAVRDQGNNRAIQRYGQRVGTWGASRNTARIGFIFPVNLSFELHYVHSDAITLFRMTEAFLILSAMSNLNYDIRFGNQLTLNSRIEIPDSTTIPMSDTGDTSKPGGGEVVLQLILHTYAGFFRDVSSVYAVDPIVGSVIKGTEADDYSKGGITETDESEFGDYKPKLPPEFNTNEPSNF